MLKFGLNSSITAARSSNAIASLPSWICPAAASWCAGGGLEHDIDECRLGPGHGELGVRGRAGAGVEDSTFHPDGPGLVEVGEGEVDPQVGVDGLVADEVDAGEVEQDVQRHGCEGVGARLC